MRKIILYFTQRQKLHMSNVRPVQAADGYLS